MFLVGCSHRASLQMSAGTGATGLTPLACKTGGVSCSVVTSVKEKGVFLVLLQGTAVIWVPGGWELHPCCTRAALHPDPRRLERGSLVAGTSWTAKGSRGHFPAGRCVHRCRVHRCHLSFPITAQKSRDGRCYERARSVSIANPFFNYIAELG